MRRFADPKTASKKSRKFLAADCLFCCDVNEGICAGNMYPIIMISSSPTALITMHNVKRFLAEAVYVRSLSKLVSSKYYYPS